jgi:hypothetical protein
MNPKYKVGQWVIPIDQRGGSNNPINVPQQIREVYFDGDKLWYILSYNYSREESVLPYITELNHNIKLL